MSLLINDVFMEFRAAKRKTLRVLDGVSLSIAEGEIGAVVGPSGCGKTTLLRLVAGFLDPSAGSIRIFDAPPRTFRQSGHLSFVFQRPLLFPWRTIYRNVVLPLQLASAQSSTTKPSEILEKLGLTEFRDYYPTEISGGMLQRAALARALVLDPRLLLLDEPLNSLDQITREQIWVDFRRVWRDSGLSVLLVSHSFSEAVFLADRIYLMTPRPSRIHMVLDVPLPADRGHETLSTPEFLRCCNELRATLAAMAGL